MSDKLRMCPLCDEAKDPAMFANVGTGYRRRLCRSCVVIYDQVQRMGRTETPTGFIDPDDPETFKPGRIYAPSKEGDTTR
jgi:hypothetical protein